MRHVNTVILGAGLAGLSTAHHLAVDGQHFLIVEGEARVGGLARTEVLDGFLFDWTGHWLHLRHEPNRRLMSDLLSDAWLEVERIARIRSHGVYTEYPFQANLHGLPLPVVKQCLMGAIEALAVPYHGPAPRHFGDYVERHFGRGIAEHFMVPYNTKLWGCPPEDITADWCSRFVPVPSLEQIVDGALGMHQRMGYNTRFVYPRTGGIERLPRALAARLPAGALRLECRPRHIDVQRRCIDLGDEIVCYRHLVSSFPLPHFIDLVTDAPADVRQARGQLRWTALRFVDLGLRSERPFGGAHWLYLPETKYPFYRIGVYSNAVPAMAPPGCSSCYVEISNRQPPDGQRIRAAVTDFLLETAAIRGPDDIVVWRQREIPVAYVIFDHHYFEALSTIRAFCATHDIHLIGRFGQWLYASMEDAFDDGRRTAQDICQRREAEEKA